MPADSPIPQSLQDRLDEITRNTRALVQPERLAATDRAIADLRATGIEDRLLPIGAEAPEFALTDATTGKLVRSADLLALGSLVVKFFRGRWDPYCMTELEAWQAILPDLRARNALLVAVSPQLPRQNAFAAEQHRLTFPLLTDHGCRLAARFGAAYTLTEEMRRQYRSILVNLPFLNGPPLDGDTPDAPWRLPLPAAYVIAQDGKILHSEANADHRVRTEPAEILSHMPR